MSAEKFLETIWNLGARNTFQTSFSIRIARELFETAFG